jgi:hypothetical protein
VYAHHLTQTYKTGIHNFPFATSPPCEPTLPRLALIQDLLFEPLSPPSNLLVEYDAASQWYNTSLTIAAEWTKSGGTVSYNAIAQSPSSIRSKLLRLGLDVEQLEKLDWEGLRILDGHAAAHGKKSTERLTFDSLKVLISAFLPVKK